MPLSTKKQDPHACDVCADSATCKRLKRCLKYKCKYGEGPEKMVYTTPEKHPLACKECVNSARCVKLQACLVHHVHFDKLKDRP